MDGVIDALGRADILNVEPLRLFGHVEEFSVASSVEAYENNYFKKQLSDLVILNS